VFKIDLDTFNASLLLLYFKSYGNRENKDDKKREMLSCALRTHVNVTKIKNMY